MSPWYALADCDAELPLVYLEAVRKERRWPVRDPAELAAVISDEFLAAEEDRLVSIMDEHNEESAHTLSVAQKYMAWWSTVAWCRKQNLKGIAPPTSLLLDEFERRRSLVPEAVRPALVKPEGARSLASKWRRRFFGRVGVVRPREDVPPAVVGEKATSACDHCFAIGVMQRTPHSSYATVVF